MSPNEGLLLELKDDSGYIKATHFEWTLLSPFFRTRATDYTKNGLISDDLLTGYGVTRKLLS